MVLVNHDSNERVKNFIFLLACEKSPCPSAVAAPRFDPPLSPKDLAQEFARPKTRRPASSIAFEDPTGKKDLNLWLWTEPDHLNSTTNTLPHRWTKPRQNGVRKALTRTHFEAESLSKISLWQESQLEA